MRVIPSLYNKPGFRSQDGWDLRTWSAQLSMPEVTNGLSILINRNNGHVITSQHKAWNDQVRMRMWLELV